MRLTEQVYGNSLAKRPGLRVKANAALQTKLDSCRAGGLISTGHCDIGEQVKEVVDVEHLRKIIDSRSIRKHNTIDSAAGEQCGNAGELLPFSRYCPVSRHHVDARTGFFFQCVGYFIRSFLFTN